MDEMPAPTPSHPSASQDSRDGEGGAALLARIALGLTGLALLVGFFLPWIRLGDLVTLNGLGMALTGGEAIHEMSGPFRAILFVVPLVGAILVFAAIRGHRAIAWAGVVGGVLILATGLFTLVRVFLDSTGSGMWVVSLSALAAIAIGFFAVRRA